MSFDAFLLVATVLLHLVGVITLHLLVGLVALLPVAATAGLLVVEARRAGCRVLGPDVLGGDR